MKIKSINITYDDSPNDDSETTEGGYTVTKADGMFRCRILLQVETLNKIRSIGRIVPIQVDKSMEDFVDSLDLAMTEIVSEINNESSRD